jgi:hypothetical protein
MKKNKPKFVFEIHGSYDYWCLTLNLPYAQEFEYCGIFTRRRDAKRAALRAARRLGWDPMQFGIKYS